MGNLLSSVGSRAYYLLGVLLVVLFLPALPKSLVLGTYLQSDRKSVV